MQRRRLPLQHHLPSLAPGLLLLLPAFTAHSRRAFLQSQLVVLLEASSGN
jgi:hypothetical protein